MTCRKKLSTYSHKNFFLGQKISRSITLRYKYLKDLMSGTHQFETFQRYIDWLLVNLMPFHQYLELIDQS